MFQNMKFFFGDTVTRLSSKTGLIKYGSIPVYGYDANVDNEKKHIHVKWHPEGVEEKIFEDEVYLMFIVHIFFETCVIILPF